jgi:hypothetical protein
VRKLKIFFLAVTVIGFAALSGGCKKTYTTVVQSADSVSSSGWLTLSTQPTIIDSYGDTGYVQTFNNSAITSAVINDGVILSYLGYTTTGTGTTTDTVAEAALEYDVYTTYQVGSVTIESPAADNGGLGDLTNSGLFYRYVIVPGSVLATTNLTKQQAKSMSYTQITAALAKAKQTSNASITQ